MNETPEITREYFSSLPPEKQLRLVQRALEWFCFIESVNPYFTYYQNETDTIKTILEEFASGMKQSGEQSMEICKNYVGVACVDGSCPKANIDKYIECGMDAIRKCEDCTYYNGCEDCVYPELIV